MQSAHFVAVNFLTVVVATATQAAADEECFATAEVRIAGGLALPARASSLAMRSSSLVIAGDGFVMELSLPADARAGERVPLRAKLQASDRLQQGTLMLDVTESGAFLAGNFRGSFGPLLVSGGLRVKRLPEGRPARAVDG